MTQTNTIQMCLLLWALSFYSGTVFRKISLFVGSFVQGSRLAPSTEMNSLDAFPQYLCDETSYCRNYVFLMKTVG